MKAPYSVMQAKNRVHVVTVVVDCNYISENGLQALTTVMNMAIYWGSLT